MYQPTLNFQLKPISLKVSHIIENTKDFLKRISKLSNIPSNPLLASLDVIGFHTQIPHDEGIEVISSYLDQLDDQTVSTESLWKLVEIAVKNIYFENGNKMYHQFLGTSIGTKLAPRFMQIYS